MTSVAYGIAFPASRGVLAPSPPPPSWLPVGKVAFADIPNGRYWANGRLCASLTEWLAAMSATFTGPAGRSYQAASGLIAYAGLNVPRIDYVSGTPYLAYEKAATNLAQYSEQLDNAWWNIKQACSITANTGPAPDGATTADAFVESNTTATHAAMRANGFLSASGTYTWGLFVSPLLRDWVRAYFYDGATVTERWCNFNMTTGAVGYSDGVLASSIRTYANGFKRVTITGVFTGTSGNIQVHSLDSNHNGTNYQFAGLNAAVLRVWGMQLEAGGPSSYIPTTSATVTRGAESISGIVAPGNLTLTFASGNTQTILPANFATAANVNEALIASIAA